MIHDRLVDFAGVDDEHSGHAHPLLHGAVRVVKERAVLVQAELVGERLPRLDWILSDAMHAIKAVRKLDAVAVEDGRLGQLVMEDDSYVVTFNGLDRRAG